VAAQTEGLESSTGAGRRCDIAAGPALYVEQNKYAIGEANTSVALEFKSQLNSLFSIKI